MIKTETCEIIAGVEIPPSLQECISTINLKLMQGYALKQITERATTIPAIPASLCKTQIVVLHFEREIPEPPAVASPQAMQAGPPAERKNKIFDPGFSGQKTPDPPAVPAKTHLFEELDLDLDPDLNLKGQNPTN